MGALQVVEKIQRLLESWTSEQQLSVEILVDDISLTSAAVTSLVKHQGSFTTFMCTRCMHVRKSLTTESVKTLVHALIASRLDYCNSVFYQFSAANLQALQSVLNAGAHLIMRKRKYDHITSTLRDDLHWLPIS